MSTAVHPFQTWMKDRSFYDVRFFPTNPSASSPTDLLDEAHRAVKAYEHGKAVPFEDNTQERHLSDEKVISA